MKYEDFFNFFAGPIAKELGGNGISAPIEENILEEFDDDFEIE